MPTGKWERIKELGRGGQRITHLAKETTIFHVISDVTEKAFSASVQLRRKEDYEVKVIP